jgi:hypothetical protein
LKYLTKLIKGTGKDIQKCDISCFFTHYCSRSTKIFAFHLRSIYSVSFSREIFPVRYYVLPRKTLGLFLRCCFTGSISGAQELLPSYSGSASFFLVDASSTTVRYLHFRVAIQPETRYSRVVYYSKNINRLNTVAGAQRYCCLCATVLFALRIW